MLKKGEICRFAQKSISAVADLPRTAAFTKKKCLYKNGPPARRAFYGFSVFFLIVSVDFLLLLVFLYLFFRINQIPTVLQ